MSPSALITLPPFERFPRVSGDEPYGWMEKINLGVFSLRERG